LPEQPFNLLKACFWLLAAVIGAVMLVGLSGTLGCMIGVMIGTFPVGHCAETGVVQTFHDWWAEILAAVFALLAARNNRPPPPPPETE
jgi:hypothetical protein